MQKPCLLCRRNQVLFCKGNKDFSVELRCKVHNHRFLAYYDSDEVLPNSQDVVLENCPRCKDEVTCYVKGAPAKARDVRIRLSRALL